MTYSWLAWVVCSWRGIVQSLRRSHYHTHLRSRHRILPELPNDTVDTSVLSSSSPSRRFEKEKYRSRGGSGSTVVEFKGKLFI